jgi:hypothetical protein
MADEKLYPTGAAAREAQCSAEWLREVIRRGHLRCVTDASGRKLVRDSDLRTFIAKRRARREMRRPATVAR